MSDFERPGAAKISRGFKNRIRNWKEAIQNLGRNISEPKSSVRGKIGAPILTSTSNRNADPRVEPAGTAKIVGDIHEGDLGVGRLHKLGKATTRNSTSAFDIRETLEEHASIQGHARQILAAGSGYDLTNALLKRSSDDAAIAAVIAESRSNSNSTSTSDGAASSKPRGLSSDGSNFRNFSYPREYQARPRGGDIGR